MPPCALSEQLPLAMALAVQIFRQMATRVVDRVREIALEGEVRSGISWILVFLPPRCLCFSYRVLVLDAVHASLNSGVAVGVDVGLSLFPLVEFLQLILLSSFQFGSIG